MYTNFHISSSELGSFPFCAHCWRPDWRTCGSTRYITVLFSPLFCTLHKQKTILLKSLPNLNKYCNALLWFFRSVCNDHRRRDPTSNQRLPVRQKWIWEGQKLEVKDCRLFLKLCTLHLFICVCCCSRLSLLFPFFTRIESHMFQNILMKYVKSMKQKLKCYLL